MKHLVSAAIVLVSLAHSGLAESPLPRPGSTILFLGDSITAAGEYVNDIETYLLASGHQPMPNIVALGLGSETVTGLTEPVHPFPRPNVHDRLDRVLERVKPDAVVACYGMNDGIYHSFSKDRFAAYQQGIRKLIEKSHAIGAKITLFDSSTVCGQRHSCPRTERGRAVRISDAVRAVQRCASPIRGMDFVPEG